MTVSQLSALLPLPEEDLDQVLAHAKTLSPEEAVTHLTGLLGDSPQVVEFISTFNSRRQPRLPAPAPQAPSYATASRSLPQGDVPRASNGRRGKKTKADLHTPQARKVDDVGPAGGNVYAKKDHDDYIPQRPAVMSKPSSSQGYLVSDVPLPSGKPKSAASSNAPSRSSTPKPSATKINITGGIQMTGGPSAALAALADLDAAIRALEMSTNPSLTGDAAARRCDCVATRHPVQTAAPNCLSCGKVVCVKEGLGPCTFCNTPLLSAPEVQDLIRELREERGREKQALNNDAQRRADTARGAPTYSKPRTGAGIQLGPTPAEEARAAAFAHRDKLLDFQSENAQRTTIRDEAADFDVSLAVSGRAGLWGSKEDRAKELRRQQAILREMEWSQKPEWEKRRVVASIDIVRGKIVKRMATVERPRPAEEAEPNVQDAAEAGGGGAKSMGNNPLRGGLIKPVYQAGGGDGGATSGAKTRGKGWTRVQDFDDEGVAGLAA